MSYRTFVDEHGTAWQVWEVHPTRVERRMTDRRRSTAPYSGPERRVHRDRRERHDHRIFLGAELAHGWLAFHSANERRRYAPIPEGWASRTVRELSELCAAAVPVAPSRMFNSMQLSTSAGYADAQREAQDKAESDGRSDAVRSADDRNSTSAA